MFKMLFSKRSAKQEALIRSLGQVKTLRVEGRGMVTQDVNEIYESESYQKAQKNAHRILSN
ncbi:hypothetical protein ACI2KR_08100 [Pseudomonas luteola]